MRFLIPILAIAIISVSIAYATEGTNRNPLQGFYFNVQKKESETKSQREAAIIKPLLQIDTAITKGPSKGEIIKGNNTVTFNFKAIAPEGEKIQFETKVEGLENEWKKTSLNERTVTFPFNAKEYKFLVRAKTKDSVDPTPAETTFKIEISPYYKKVRVTKVTPPSSFNSVIRLETRLGKDEEINITGWQVKGRYGTASVPKGLEKYRQGKTLEDIIIRKGDNIYISAEKSPLDKDKSFRLNRCLGYLYLSSNYSLNIPRSCPRPKKEEIKHLNPCCQEFILQNRGCEIPDYSKNLKVAYDSECISFMENYFNYMSCFNRHSNEGSFLQNTWYIFLRKDIVTADFCDTIYLFDENGLLVDEYSYGKDVCR